MTAGNLEKGEETKYRMRKFAYYSFAQKQSKTHSHEDPCFLLFPLYSIKCNDADNDAV